jgi:hypothetical protein
MNLTWVKPKDPQLQGTIWQTLRCTIKITTRIWKPRIDQPNRLAKLEARHKLMQGQLTLQQTQHLTIQAKLSLEKLPHKIV